MSGQHFKLTEALQSVDENMIYQAGQEWKQEKGKSGRPYYKSARLKAACAALVILACAGGIFHEQVSAALGRFTTMIGAGLDNENDLSEYTHALNQSQTKGGVTMELKEAVLDNNRLIAGVVIDAGEEAFLEDASAWYGWIKVNGEYVEERSLASYEMGNIPGGYVLEAVLSDSALLEKAADVEFLVNFAKKREGEAFYTSEEQFIFSFVPGAGKGMSSPVKIPLAGSVRADEGIVFEFTELSFTAISGQILAKCDEDPGIVMHYDEADGFDGTEYPYCVLVADGDGNESRFELTGYDEASKTACFMSTDGTMPGQGSGYLEITLQKYSLKEQEADGALQELWVPEKTGEALKIKMK